MGLLKFDTPPMLVFDLDGTMIDTAPDLLQSLNHVIVSDGLAPVNTQKLRKFVGFGGRVMIQNAYDDARQHLEEDKLDYLVEKFIAHYAANMPGASTPYPGLLDALATLRLANCKFAVCTNKTESLSKQLLEALNLSGELEAICGQDTFPVRKPHPGHLVKTIELAGGDPSHAIMIGDTPTDFSTARAASVALVAVDFGYCDEPVSKYQPDSIISHYDELTPELINSLLKQQQYQ